MTVVWHEPRTSAFTGENCVIVTVDAAHLRDPVTPSTIRDIAARTKADEINRILTAQLAMRKAAGSPLPLVAIVVTKTDQLRLSEGHSRPRPDPSAAQTLRASGPELLAYLMFWHSLNMGAMAMSASRSQQSGYTAPGSRSKTLSSAISCHQLAPKSYSQRTFLTSTTSPADRSKLIVRGRSAPAVTTAHRPNASP